MTTTKNYTYGAKSPDIEHAVVDAIRSAHRYRNRLCELELQKRARHEELLQRLAPAYVEACKAVDAAEEQLTNVREAIQSERVKQRTKAPQGIDHLTNTAKELMKALRELRATRKAAKQAAYDDAAVAEAMQKNQEQHKQECATAKAESGLYWGTEAIVTQACRSFSSGSPPRFARWEGEGQLAVQLQNGMDTRAVFDIDTRLQLIIPDKLQERLTAKGKAPRSMRRGECLIRIGSEGRSPIFAKVPIVFHRLLPPGRIKWAYLERRMMANRPVWKIRLTIDCDESTKPRDTRKVVAVHVGWCIQPGGLRVANWLGSDGKTDSLVLSSEHIADYAKLDMTQSRRKVQFNETIEKLREWLKDREVPEWMTEATSHIHQWKSQQRLAWLVTKWRDERFDGDEIFEILDQWRKQDKHQWQHERRLSARIVRRRKDIFRVTAKQLSREYGVAIIAPIAAEELNRNRPPEDLERDPTQCHRHAKWAAVSDFLTCIQEAFPLHCVKTDAANITKQCHNCGNLVTSEKRRVQCRECGKTWDVDDNAVVNTLARGEVSLKNGALFDVVAAKEDTEKAKREKLLKMQEARRQKNAARKMALEANGDNELGR